MTPDQKRFQRELALKHVARFRADAKHPLPDLRIAAAVAPGVKASSDQVLKWMREARA